MINVGLIGFGYWAQNYYRLFSEINDSKLLWIADKNLKTLAEVKKKTNNIKITQNYLDILKDNNVQAVIIATPTITHEKICKDALKAGKHILVEKPLSVSAKGANLIKNLATRKKSIVLVGHTFIFHSAIKFLKNYIQNGELGEIFYLYSTRTNLGPIRTDVNVIYDLASHDVSTILYLLDKKPISISAQGTSFKRQNFPDVAFLNLTFKNNLIASAHVSWLDPVKIRRLTIVGNKKMAVFDDMEATEKVKIYDKGASFYPKGKTFGEWLVSLRLGDVWIPKIDFTEPLKLELSHFLDCIKTGKKPESAIQHGIDVIRVLEAANSSLKQGKRVIF